MTTARSDTERLSALIDALIDAKLADFEKRASDGKLPSTSELNAIRRLLDWRECERELADARELTAG